MPSNNAVWLPAKYAELEIKPAPYTAPRPSEIVVKNSAVAINPLDWLTQSMGGIMLPWTKYPFILGSDVAGVVAEVGTGVTRFKVGDRVLGHAVGADKSRNSAAEGAFHPSDHAEPTGKVLLVWGGSTSVGSNAIQLAVAAGYEVITTASPKNFDYVRGLGATQGFDYKSKTAVKDIIKALKGRTIAGALSIGTGSAEACVKIVGACNGAKLIALATPSVSFVRAPIGGRRRIGWVVPTMAKLIWANVTLMINSRRKGIKTKYIFGTSLIENEVGSLIYRDFLPTALAEGRYVAAPPPQVVGHGLGDIPRALEAQKRGVSAKKLVVTL